jgi:hypothetical protein
MREDGPVARPESRGQPGGPDAGELERAVEQAEAACSTIASIHTDLVQLARTRAGGAWDADEFVRFLELSRRARAAQRHYLACWGHFDSVRRRLNRASGTR